MNDRTHTTPEKTKPHLRTKRTLGAHDAAYQAFEKLPFIVMRDVAGLPAPDPDKGELPRCYWHVSPTGKFWKDRKTGQDYARQYLNYLSLFRLESGDMISIARDMALAGRSGISDGFLSTIDAAARAGAQFLEG